MASEPFQYLQHSIEIKDKTVDQLQNNTGSGFYLFYTNDRLRDPPSHAPEMSNSEKLRARYVTRSIKLLRRGDNKEMCHFTIEGFGKENKNKYESFGSGYVNHMTIWVEDLPIFRKKGLARVLISGMIQGIESEGITIDTIRGQKLFINVDASDGFWEHISMVENPRGINWNRPNNNTSIEEGNGYEKMTTIGGILDYLRTPSKSNRQSTSRSRTERSPSRSPRRSARSRTRRSSSRSPRRFARSRTRRSPSRSPRRSTRSSKLKK